MTINYEQMQNPATVVDLPKVTPQDVAKFAFMGFKFSRGRPGLQRVMTENIIGDNPELANDVNFPEAKEITYQLTKTFMSKDHNHRKRQFSDQIILDEVEIVFDMIINATGLCSPVPIDEVVSSLVDVEQDYLNRTSSGSEDYRQKFYSNLVAFGLCSKSSGNPYFDEMFRNVGLCLRETDFFERHPTLKNQVFELKKAHLFSNPHHI